MILLLLVHKITLEGKESSGDNNIVINLPSSNLVYDKGIDFDYFKTAVPKGCFYCVYMNMMYIIHIKIQYVQLLDTYLAVHKHLVQYLNIYFIL